MSSNFEKAKALLYHVEMGGLELQDDMFACLWVFSTYKFDLQSFKLSTAYDLTARKQLVSEYFSKVLSLSPEDKLASLQTWFRCTGESGHNQAIQIFNIVAY